MSTRRSVLVAAVAASFGLTLSLAAGQSLADDYMGGWQNDHPTIKYGIISIETSVDILKSQEEFAKYAAEELGVEFEVFTASEYAGIMNALSAGQIQVGWLGASSYATTWLDCECVEPIAGAQDPYGAMGYNSVLIVKADSPYQSYEDLKGKTVARNDPHSTSGFLIPTVSWHEMGTPVRSVKYSARRSPQEAKWVKISTRSPAAKTLSTISLRRASLPDRPSRGSSSSFW